MKEKILKSKKRGMLVLVLDVLALIASVFGVIGGGIVYYIIYNFVILLGLKTDYLKMLSAIIVVLFLAIPYLKSEYFTKRKPLPVQALSSDENSTGGDANA